ncbi:MAG: carboxypeptidase-like regulatory domain-containing protein [Sphingobacteriaceae bacterium]|nr:carboxypeptidase-like regulatory domain-containing protein [Sphingobacteriaceae bacterium]
MQPFSYLPIVLRAAMASLISMLVLFQVAAGQSADSTFMLEGQVVDIQNSGPLAYVNIGIANKNIGTVSAADGQFKLQLNEKQLGDTVSFSFIGYESLRIPVQMLLELRIPVVMTPKSFELQEIVVKSRRYKERFFGYFTEGKTAQAGFNENVLGKECGVPMRTKKPTLLEEVQINFGTCTYDSVFFRLNFYQMSAKGEYEPVLNEPQYYAFSKGELLQTLAIDIRNLNIQVQGQFMVSVEYYRDLGPGRLFFKSKLNGSSLIRATSQAKWVPIPLGISLGVFGQVEH